MEEISKTSQLYKEKAKRVTATNIIVLFAIASRIAIPK